MKNRILALARMLLLGMFAFTVFGCGGAYMPAGSSPSDAEVLKAIHNSGLFTGGAEKFVLKTPIEIMEIGAQNKDGSWSVKVRIAYVSTRAGKGEPELFEKTPVFRIYPSKNSSGKSVWKAVVSS